MTSSRRGAHNRHVGAPANLVHSKFMRNPLSKEQQHKLRTTKFAIIGLGGTGGFIFENLIRMGAEKFVLFDHDRFEFSNFNRQILATDDFLDIPKVHAAIARAKSINSNIKITLGSSKTGGRFDESSSIHGASIVLDGSDNLPTKLAAVRVARKAKRPFVYCAASSTRGMVSVFTKYSFEKAFQLRKGLKVGVVEEVVAYKTCQTILCPAAALAGTIAATQALNIVLKKPIVKAPEALFFDLYRKDIFWRAKLG